MNLSARYCTLAMISAFLWAGSAAPLWANPAKPPPPKIKAHAPVKEAVKSREQNQRERIKAGIKSGELTQKEAAELIAEQKEIEKLEKEMMKDGRLDPQESATLKARRDAASKRIRDQRHDGQKK